MSEAQIATISESILASDDATLAESAAKLSRAREIMLLGSALALCQVLDGVLTALGIKHFGIAIEANLLLRWAMSEFGDMAALLLFKCGAILIVLSLCYLSSQVRWVKPAMKMLVLVYVFGAILPWGYILIPRMI